uniref:Uncharacterized protein n=1 Tax=Acrobeloides nanus TaxID=290746 RepID=A0A914CGI1_9BILA
MLILGVLLSSNLFISFVVGDSIGFDTIHPLSVSQFQCLNNTYNYVFLRVGKADGSIDNVGLQNIKNANQGGFTYQINPYFYPNISINSSDQLSQIQNSLNNAENPIAPISILYVNINPLFWSSDKMQNQKYMTELNNEITNANYFPGYYTSYSSWDQVFGVDFVVSPTEESYLWWTQLNGIQVIRLILLKFGVFRIILVLYHLEDGDSLIIINGKQMLTYVAQL